MKRIEAGKVHKNDIFTFFVADVSHMSSILVRYAAPEALLTLTQNGRGETKVPPHPLGKPAS